MSLLVILILLTACGAKEPDVSSTAATKTKWTVTQYASEGGGQAMAYTITDTEDHLVIIDGGVGGADANRLEQIIAAHDFHVDAWIITHTHPDHADAFNIVMQDENIDFTIDHLYTVPYNTKRYRETARDYDNFPVHETFVALAEELPYFEQLQENDELDLIGLKMKVLHVWDEDVDAFDHNLCNYGSMMFRLDAPHSSMLFCADVEKEMEDIILAKHADELTADYIQCGHHGNWGLTEKFYDKVEGVQEAFFDGPDFLYAESDTYDGYLLKQYFEERGATVHTFGDAPSEIVLK